MGIQHDRSEETASGTAGQADEMRATKTERELVRRMVAGDASAFDEFADGYLPGLYRFAAARLAGDRELTRDIVQSTACKVIAKIASFRGEAALMTWLCACCRNEIAAHFRRHMRSAHEVDLEVAEETGAGESVTPPPDGPESAAIRRQAADLVHVALDTLPAHYSQALDWKYLEELPVSEIAGRLNLGLKAAESLLTRARQAFRDSYGRLAATPGRAASAPAWIGRRMELES